MNPQDIKSVGTSEQNINPKISAANGYAPDNNIEAIPESTCSKLTVENIYGRANENVECISRNITTKTGLIEMKLEMSVKFVNGSNPIEMNVIV